MAIDGVDIIDSDSAHDVHNAIVEGWRDGKPASELLDEVLSWEADFCFDPLETEIYWTALALSLWKIGALQDDVHQRMLEVIAHGATSEWLKIDPSAQRERQRRLDQLVRKLQSPSGRPIRPARATKTPRQPHFAVGDVLSVELPTGEYGACVLIELEQTPRKIEYNFSIVHLRQLVEPTLDDVFDAEIASAAPSDRLPDGGLYASCWTDQKTLDQVLGLLRRIGHVDIGAQRMLAFAPALGADSFVASFLDDFFVGQHLRPVRECFAPPVEPNE